MKIELGELLVHCTKAAAAACLIGGGTMVLKTSNQNAVQDTEIVALKEAQASSVDTMRELNKSVQALDKNVAVLNERLKER